MKFLQWNTKKIKETLKRGIATLTLGASLVSPFALSGCTKREQATNVQEQPTVVDVDNSAPTSDVTIEYVPVSTPVPATYDAATWEAFVSNAWAGIQGKINNVDYDAFRAAVTIFNIDMLDTNNAQILIDYYSQGMDTENELSKAYSLLSQMREYNTTADDTYNVSNLLVSEKDKAIINVLEDDLRIVKSSDTDVARIEQIFETVKNFSLGTGKLAVVIGGQIVEVPQTELSKGGIMLSENIMQAISVECQNIIAEERRAELDNSLNAADALAGIQEIMIRNNAISSVVNQQTSEEAQQDIIDQVNFMLNAINTEVSPMGVNADEVKALFMVANANYFESTADTQAAFKAIYGEVIDFPTMFNNAESAVEKLEMYNISASTLYDYGHFFIDSTNDIISIKGLVDTVHQLYSPDRAVVDNAIYELKGYTQYNPLATINYQTVDEYGNVSEFKSLDKNALTLGGNQVADWITYYAFTNARGIINNDQLTNDMLSLVNGTSFGFIPYDDIVLMYTGFCAANNEATFQYKIGERY